MERDDHVTIPAKVRKRKAENQDNERLSKRLSLLNLERNGQKLYVPVEQPFISSAPSTKSKPPIRVQDNDIMQLDDTAHKVYIYDLDAELSDSESSDDGKLVFLPDIKKHLRATRIPPSVLANSEGELAGLNNQLVLYNIPSSLTIPEEQDSVRKAIIETRARAREKQRQIREERGRSSSQTTEPVNYGETESRDWFYSLLNGTASPTAQEVMPTNGTSLSKMEHIDQMVNDDPDAMDLG